MRRRMPCAMNFRNHVGIIRHHYSWNSLGRALRFVILIETWGEAEDVRHLVLGADGRRTDV